MTKLKCCEIKDDAYEIDEYGNIYSNYYKKLIKPQFDKDGFLVCMLKTNDNKRKEFRIHRLVAFTFIGDPPKNLKNPTVDHIDHDRTNNYYKNLLWKEHGQNSKEKNSELIRGNKNPKTKLTEIQVIEICKLLNNGESFSSIGKKYNVNPTTIRQIKIMKNWKWLTKDYLIL